jgi:uncharacterized membrane protein YeaQ/YmgE (transglycosylase-associated protein family)
VGIIAFLILGLLAGVIAKAVMPGYDPGGLFVTMAIGVVGAILGGFLAKIIFHVDAIQGFFNLSSWIAAIVGSIILLILYRMVSGRRV